MHHLHICSAHVPCRTLRYEERAALAKNTMARNCLELMARKKSNLSVAADVDTAEEMLQLADKVGYMTFYLMIPCGHVHMAFIASMLQGPQF